ncbi:MAG: hypothetical protein NZ772_00480 [Cyanobacteria bacterium]|nr:hypothetical protein [Cyanobacteriota bacterium]MDW8199825.1 hypothetical protein [Cyanobacteriota bacterium SKYGB_h_bin112]
MTHQLPKVEPSSPSSDRQPWSMDVSVDDVMNDVFEELDQLLDNFERGQTVVEMDDGYSPSPEPIVGHEPAMPLTLVPPVAPSPSVSSQDPELVPPETAPSDSGRQASSLVDRLMLGTAIAAVLATAVVGWINRQDIYRFVATVIGQPAPPVTAPSLDPQVAADLQFIDYVQRSLEVINSTAAKPDSLPVAVNPNGLPTVPVSGSPAQPSMAPTVLERVYIPVYQPPQMFYMPPTAQSPAAVPSVAAQAPKTATVAPVPSPLVSPVPTETVTLVGLLDLGKKSAALFEINGSPQRIYPGEAIGNTGWTMVRIAGQEAVIRRNGEVRSVYVGQKL